MKVELVVFDIAGTTLKDREDAVSAAFTKAMEENRFNFSNAEIKSVMGYKKREAIQMLLANKEIPADTPLVDKLHDAFIKQINHHYKTAQISEIEGVSALFAKLRAKGIRVALNTGFSRSTTDIIITRLGWLEKNLIDGSIASDEAAHGRPEPDMIEALRSRFGITSSSRIIKVGDTPSDLLEGKNAGCGKNIGVLYGTHNRSELETYPHDYLAENIEDLTEAILSYVS